MTSGLDSSLFSRRSVSSRGRLPFDHEDSERSSKFLCSHLHILQTSLPVHYLPQNHAHLQLVVIFLLFDPVFTCTMAFAGLILLLGFQAFLASTHDGAPGSSVASLVSQFPACSIPCITDTQLFYVRQLSCILFPTLLTSLCLLALPKPQRYLPMRRSLPSRSHLLRKAQLLSGRLCRKTTAHPPHLQAVLQKWHPEPILCL